MSSELYELPQQIQELPATFNLCMLILHKLTRHWASKHVSMTKHLFLYILQGTQGKHFATEY